MKKLKGAVAIIFLLVVSYFLISYGIFWITKPLLDHRLDSFSQVATQLEQPKDAVVIQNLEPVCANGLCSLHNKDEFAMSYDEDQDTARDAVSDENALLLPEVQDMKEGRAQGLYASFITMNIPDDYQMEQDLEDTLDVLIGNDVDEFVKIILQSNNDIVSQQVCRACSMFAFFNAIKQHKPLSVEDLRILQKMLANLYRFVENMQKLSNTIIFREEQYAALQDLHTSQAIKNDIKLKKRQAVTSAALKKLQMIQYNR